MPDYVITPKGGGAWRCQLASCSQAHAESVLAQLEADHTAPDGLQLHEVDRPKRGLLRRLLHRG